VHFIAIGNIFIVIANNLIDLENIIEVRIGAFLVFFLI